MKTYTEAELNEILRNHKHWILKNIDGWKEMRADLRGASLCGADLRGADLRGANLREVKLCGANLCIADLRRADLCEADLYGANLYGADLCGAKNIPFIPMTCPDIGTFVSWKRQTDTLLSWRFQRMPVEVPQREESADAIKRK